MSAHQDAHDRSRVDAADVERFSRLGEEWWDTRGAMRMLHRINPLRIGFIRDRLIRNFPGKDGERDVRTAGPLQGLRLLDVGCGGGILCEPLARLGATVTGIDPSAENVAIAVAHAAEQGLRIDYQGVTVEALQASGKTFDAVLAMEVVEHVPDPASFMASVCALIEPQGMLFASTLDRTLKSFALAIVGAEYVLRWLPRGTHRWDQFVRPNELREMAARGGVRIATTVGVMFDPLRDAWRIGRDTDVNYMVAGRKRSLPVDRGAGRGMADA